MDLRRTSQKLLTDSHVRVYRLTNGKVGGRFGHTEFVLLTTTGRKSGTTRATPLNVTVDGDRLILVASNGGAPTHPDWYLNLRDQPRIGVQRGASRLDMIARTASPEERAALWDKVVASWKGYEGYQAKTTREIPLVVCEPSA